MVIEYLTLLLLCIALGENFAGIQLLMSSWFEAAESVTHPIHTQARWLMSEPTKQHVTNAMRFGTLHFARGRTRCSVPYLLLI